MSEDKSESRLIQQCLKGDSQAWDEMFNLHYAPTARFIFQLAPDLSVDDADEICQEVFLSAIRNLNFFKGNSQIRTWLFRIATNKARDYRQKRNAAKRGGGVSPIPLDAEDPSTGQKLDPPADSPRPDQWLEVEEQSEMLHTALAKLGDPCREVIELRYFGDLSYEEISAALHLNPKTVSSRLSKCLGKLELIVKQLISRENNQRNTV
jgi:RNA polymerase sigma-70 factor (ECF subfamily)